MDKNDFKNEISKEIDAVYFDLARQLEERDFSKDSNKEVVFLNTLKKINKIEGEKNMKVIDKVKKVGLAVASIALVTTIGMQTTFAQDIVEKIIARISLGHFTAIQYEYDGVKESTIPASLKGKLFDKDGKLIEIFTEEVKEVYTAQGEKIDSFEVNGNIITAAQQEKLRKENTLTIKDSKELNDYTCFNVILPSYLPAGYVFDRAEFYKDEKGIVNNTKYISLYFANQKTGKTIYMQQRLADEETASVMGTDSKVEKIKINGIDAILEDNTNLDWEAYGNIYFLNVGKTDGEVGKEELIKIAESVK